jgi:isopentenyldiphosphate isomerase
MSDYIEWIRGKVGHDQIFLNFSGACITNDEGKILLQKRAASSITFDRTLITA